MALHIRIINTCNMIIKRNIYFALKIRRNAKGERLEKNLPIRMRISYNWNYKDFYTGYNIDLVLMGRFFSSLSPFALRLILRAK